jgi:hypothetical protein
LDAISDDVQDRIIINLEEESEDSSENSDCDYSDDELATPLL